MWFAAGEDHIMYEPYPEAKCYADEQGYQHSCEYCVVALVPVHHDRSYTWQNGLLIGTSNPTRREPEVYPIFYADL